MHHANYYYDDEGMPTLDEGEKMDEDEMKDMFQAALCLCVELSAGSLRWRTMRGR